MIPIPIGICMEIRIKNMMIINQKKTMTFLEMYYYLFYKYLKFFQSIETTNWLTDLKAGIAVFSLEVWLLFSLQFYYNFIMNKRTRLEFFSIKIFLPFIMLAIIKWLFFFKDSKWKLYSKKFDQLTPSVNKKGTWIVAIITIFCFANLIYSLYLNSLLKLG